MLSDAPNRCKRCFYKYNGESNYQHVFSHLFQFKCKNAFETLKEHKMYINTIYCGQSPLLLALEVKYFKSAVELILLGANVNITHYNNTPLQWAVHYNNEEMIRLGANVNKPQQSMTPLSWAVYHNNEEMINFLLENGAQRTINSAFLEAIRCKNLKIVQLLREKGALVNIQEITDYRPLILATQQQSLEIVEYLLNEGADVNENDINGSTPLILAVKDAKVDLVKLLVQKGANINQNDEHSIPLILAIETKETEIIKCLVDAGADVNARSEHYTPLTLAVQKVLENFDIYGKPYFTPEKKSEYKEIIEFLVRAGADVYRKDKRGKSPLFMAAFYHNLEFFDFFMKAGADVIPTVEEIEEISKVDLDFGVSLLLRRKSAIEENKRTNFIIEGTGNE